MAIEEINDRIEEAIAKLRRQGLDPTTLYLTREARAELGVERRESIFGLRIVEAAHCAIAEDMWVELGGADEGRRWCPYCLEKTKRSLLFPHTLICRRCGNSWPCVPLLTLEEVEERVGV